MNFCDISQSVRRICQKIYGDYVRPTDKEAYAEADRSQVAPAALASATPEKAAWARSRSRVEPQHDNGKEKSRALESDQAGFHFPCCGFIETCALDSLRIVARRGGRWEMVKS